MSGGTSSAPVDVREAGEEAATARYVARWWGQFGLVDNETGTSVLPRGQRARAILAMLCARPSAPILRSGLAAIFWGDRGDEQARASVRQSLAELRNLARGEAPLLAIDALSIALIPDRLVTRTAQLDEFSASGDCARFMVLLDSGDGFLAGLDGISTEFDQWLRTERAQALESLVAASIACAQTAWERGDATSAQKLIHRMQVIDPLEERLARAGFEADALAGDAAALERRLRALEKHLKDELEVAPSQATMDAHAAALLRVRSTPMTAARQVANGHYPLSDKFSRRQLAAGAVFSLLLLAAIIWLAEGPNASIAKPRTIAVLPFDASSEQQDLASGISEEIVSRLSRNPRIEPLGRASSRILGDDPSTSIALGRELRVDYLLSGRLEGRGKELTIIARLIRTRDGSVAWDDTINGGAAELIPMMDRLSSAVSSRIGAGSLPPATDKPPKPEANQLYLSALGLARDGEPDKVSTAVELIRQASRIDPDYAPIWSTLGTLTRTEHLEHLKPDDDDVSINQLAQAYARRGLELAPDSAAANLAMGDTLAEDPRSIPYVLRALEIDPHNSGAWSELADKYLKAGDFVRWNRALNNAAILDPLASWAELAAADSNSELGYLDRARGQFQILAKHGRPQPFMRHFIQGGMLANSGDLSEALNEFDQAAHSPNAIVWANAQRGRIFWAVGMLDEARPLSGVISANPEDWDLYNGRDPGPSALDVGRKNPVYAWNMQERNYLLLRILINEKRYSNVAGLYDRRFRSPEEFARTPRGHVSFVDDSIPVVVALRQVGREREADRIYTLARDAVAVRYRAGPVPPYYEVLAAQLYAIGGNQATALDALTRAVNRGWLNRLSLSMPSITDEPAFASLRGNPRFEALRKRMESLYARERAEILSARSRNAPGGS